MMHRSFCFARSLSATRLYPRRWLPVVAALVTGIAAPRLDCQSPSSSGLLASRAELTAEAATAEASATVGDPAQRAANALRAAAFRERLRDGDFRVGDRVIVTVVSDAVHRDSVVVRADRSLELNGMIVVPLAGVLRSELTERVSTEVLKYVKAQKIEVTPLIRVGVLGAVSRPGYFAFPSDIPLTDAIMGAGGPTSVAAVDRSIVRRHNQEYRSSSETGKAIAGGLTLDQFGLAAGDELVVGERRDIGVTKVLSVAGALASVLAVFVALNR